MRLRIQALEERIVLDAQTIIVPVRSESGGGGLLGGLEDEVEQTVDRNDHDLLFGGGLPVPDPVPVLFKHRLQLQHQLQPRHLNLQQ